MSDSRRRTGEWTHVRPFVRSSRASRTSSLGEVDRLTWQRDNPIPPRNDGPMYAVPLPTALPSISEIPNDPSKRREDEKGSDPELCFAVHYGYD